MEWVETTGRTVEQAKDAALDQLGVDEQEAEFELLEEPRTGLFGRTRGEARVRARVKPRQPRAKTERGSRRRRQGNEGNRSSRGGRKGRGGNDKGAKSGADTSGAASKAPKGQSSDRDDAPAPAAAVAGASPAPAAGGADEPRPPRSRGGRGRGGRGGSDRAPHDDANQERSPDRATTTATTKEQAMTEDVTVDEQAEIIEGFLDGLVEAFGVEAEIRKEKVDDETIELDLVGEDLGLLIGPKGRTLWAIQELSRTVVQRQASGTHHGRVRVDVGGYRQRRKEALERFTRQLAAEVQESGVARSLEPMGAADRKIVHDTVNEMDGISTTSEGEEPRRRVVIVPAD
ncbi:MAG: Jag N-terminal domain-containing protein [Acidimicrobiales bacterium]|nr:Jag N-terminal domain-containing protein [Acidimicrobiales bacterium]